MRYLRVFVILFFIIFNSSAQDTLELEAYTRNYNFNEGIFLTFEDVLNNSPIPKSNIITNIDKNSFNFFDLLIEENLVSIIQSSGQIKTIDPSLFWGFSKKGKLYIYWERSATLIPIVGSISHFIGVHEIINYPQNHDPFQYYAEPNKRYETVQYIIDFSNGAVYEFNTKNIEPIFTKDEKLYSEWIELRRRKKKKLIFVYLRKYNENNPLMLPKIN